MVQAALAGTDYDEGSDHAENQFGELDARGPDAWRETALILIQHLFSTGCYGHGPDAAER